MGTLEATASTFDQDTSKACVAKQQGAKADRTTRKFMFFEADLQKVQRAPKNVKVENLF